MDFVAYSLAKKYIDNIVSDLPKGINYKGAVDYVNQLPSSPALGDAYTVMYQGTSGTDPDGREFVWGNYNGTNTWIDFGPDLSGYQEALVSGTNIKTINGNSVLGSGDMRIATNQQFPQGWPTTGTVENFCSVVNADSTAIQGMSFLGEVTWNNFPAGISNAEVVVQIMSGTGTSNKVIHLILTSGNVDPYRWEYTYWSNGSLTSGWIPFQTKLVSGTNIKTINNQSILGSGNIDTNINELFIITVDKTNDNSTDVSYADARAAYNAGKTLLLKITGYNAGDANIATLYAVYNNSLQFSYSASDSRTEVWSFSLDGMSVSSYQAVLSVNGIPGPYVPLRLETHDGFMNIEGSGSNVLSGMALHTLEYDQGGATFAQLWATVVQALASTSSCHLRIANPAAWSMPWTYAFYYQTTGQTMGMAICLNQDNTQRLFGIPCGGGLDSDAGAIALQFRGPVSQLGTDVVVSAVFTITDDGVIYIDAEKISGYTDLGGKTLSELTTEIQAAFEAVSYSYYEEMQEGLEYTIGGYSWTCHSADSPDARALSGDPETVSINVDVILDTENETVDSVDVSKID